jgi:hypothetical protein
MGGYLGELVNWKVLVGVLGRTSSKLEGAFGGLAVDGRVILKWILGC